MERTLSPEEKIKRAEEIYNRRRNQHYRSNVATVNVSESRNYGLLKRIILQISICLVIYFIFYLIQSSNYIFSEDVLNKTKDILSYDINLPAMYSEAIQYINTNWTTKFKIEEQNSINTQNSEETSNSINNSAINDDITNAIGGGNYEEIMINENETASIEENSNQTQLTDEDYIKKNFSFIKPVEGIVSSEFGVREVNSDIVSKNHTGIDIAADTGTVINAAMEGTVTVSSTIGTYGYHIKISNNDISTLYAHCSKLYVKAGDKVKQGQAIAEVGSTGNSTGPHLHFEIIRNTNYINPRSILEF